jgi:hypothetical protein
MRVVDYMQDAVRQMQIKSAAVRRDFATHRQSGGQNRESILDDFLEQHLPKRFGVSTGLVISHEGAFSNQADLLIVDHLNNSPYHAGRPNVLWPVEAVYALLEVKTSLTLTELRDAVDKGRRFKCLRRDFCDNGVGQRTTESLFVIWGYESPDPMTVKSNLVDILKDVPREEQPDFIVVPDSFVANGGTYLEISKLGQKGSEHRRKLEATHKGNVEHLIPEPLQVVRFGADSLLVWFTWFDSWLRQSGGRCTDPVRYIPDEGIDMQVV